LNKIVITIDGPAASGKGEIANYISKKWKYKHLDSGILYRRLALILYEKKINILSIKSIRKVIQSQKTISFRKNKKLRSEKISEIASKIATHTFVRNYINKFQRSFVNKSQNHKKFVIDGRDIGSVVFKKADLKLYIEVSEKNRAKRRYKQLIDTGEKSIYLQILKDIKLRDTTDKNRKNSPLVVPNGAFVINNNGSFQITKIQINKLVNKL
tara:strand:- start:165 stop:800 length:636 start_codon:yes stop_codon:yes gene_type:complete